jgi:hypothetical protein
MSNQDVSEISLARLFGVGGGPIRWGCALAFYIALLVSDPVVMVLNARLSYPVDELPRLLVDSWLDNLVGIDLHGWLWPSTLTLSPLIFTICALVALRFLRRVEAAALVGAFAYAALQLLVRSFLLSHHPLQSLLSPNFLLLSWSRFAWAFLFLVGLRLGLRWVRPWWLGLAAGAAAADMVQDFVVRVGNALIQFDITYQVHFVLREELTRSLFAVCSAALFAGVFWIGREVACAERGRLSKAFYLGSAAAGLGLALTLELLAWNDVLSNGPNDLAQALALIAVMAALYFVVSILILVYRMWATIQDGHARATPFSAVGLLFAPRV